MNNLPLSGCKGDFNKLAFVNLGKHYAFELDMGELLHTCKLIASHFLYKINTLSCFWYTAQLIILIQLVSLVSPFAQGCGKCQKQGVHYKRVKVAVDRASSFTCVYFNYFNYLNYYCNYYYGIIKRGDKHKDRTTNLELLNPRSWSTFLQKKRQNFTKMFWQNDMLSWKGKCVN